MANFLYDILAIPVGNRLIAHRIHFTPKGNHYQVVSTDICGTVTVSKSKWGWFIKKGNIPLSVRLTFKSGNKEIKTLARWKMDMDESTTTLVKLGSIRECILVTLQGELLYPGSEVADTPSLQGDWDLNVEIIDGDTLEVYSYTQIKGVVIEGKLAIPDENLDAK